VFGWSRNTCLADSKSNACGEVVAEAFGDVEADTVPEAVAEMEVVGETADPAGAVAETDTDAGVATDDSDDAEDEGLLNERQNECTASWISWSMRI